MKTDDEIEDVYKERVFAEVLTLDQDGEFRIIKKKKGKTEEDYTHFFTLVILARNKNTHLHQKSQMEFY